MQTFYFFPEDTGFVSSNMQTVKNEVINISFIPASAVKPSFQGQVKGRLMWLK